MNDEITLTVRFTADGSVKVNGPLANKVLCYGLLEMAKDVVRKHDPTQRIVRPAVVAPFTNQ